MSDQKTRSPRDHAFVRSSDPHFGAHFGGACDHREDGTVCGWPERSHKARSAETQGEVMTSTTTTWAELFPNGRDIFYEGDTPDQFAEEMVAKFGFDPRADRRWWDVIPDGEKSFTSYRFHCPTELLDAIYGGDYPLGS